jgi:adenine deaminase
MSAKRIAFDSHAFLAQSVRRLLADAGPLTSKEIVRRLRQGGSPLLRASAVRKVLDQTLINEVERQKGNTYALIKDDVTFTRRELRG